jgi:hypothetical protein
VVKDDLNALAKATTVSTSGVLLVVLKAGKIEFFDLLGAALEVQPYKTNQIEIRKPTLIILIVVFIVWYY